MRYLITIITFFLALNINAQQIEKQVISSTGNDVSAGGLQISQTVGEVAVETYTSGSFILGQGFQQVEEIDKDTTIAIKEIDMIVNYNLYPNPTNDVINIELELNANASLQITLVNVQGKIISQKTLALKKDKQSVIQFNLDNESKGIYFLQFQDREGTISKVVAFNKF